MELRCFVSAGRAIQSVEEYCLQKNIEFKWLNSKFDPALATPTGINLIEPAGLEAWRDLPHLNNIVLVGRFEQIPKRLPIPVLDILHSDADRAYIRQRMDVWALLVGENSQSERSSGEEAYKRKMEFLTLIDHEFRTPLAILSTALSTLKIQCESSEDREYFEILQQAQAAAQQLEIKLGLIGNTLKLQGNPADEHWNEIDLKGIVISIASRLKPLLNQRKIEMGFRLKEELWTRGDAYYLNLLLEQLLSNAVRYTPQGGKVSVAGTLAGNRIIIVVSDTGIGLPEETRQKLFDPFAIGSAWENHQTDETDPHGGNLGLGLYLCKRIVELHGGKIWAESAGENQGSKFFVSLPVYTQQED